MLWFLALTLNGLLFFSYEPFKTEAACQLAAELADDDRVQCLEVPLPELPVGESKHGVQP